MTGLLTSVAPAAVALVLLCLVVALVVGRRSGWSGARTFWTFVCSAGFAGVALLTLGREGQLPRWNPVALREVDPAAWWRLLEDPWTVQSIANVILFVPFVLGLAMLVRRPGVALVAGWALVVVVEILQGLFALGLPDVADVVTNAVGCLVGACAASVLLLLGAVRARTGWGEPTAVLVLGAVVLASGNWLSQIGAEQRQRDLAATLEDVFGGTSLADHRQWEAQDRLEEEVFSRVSGTRSDGASQTEDVASARWPASVGPARRCVFVHWDAAGARISARAGGVCDRLVG